MNGAVELYKACREARHQADRRLRDLPRRRPHATARGPRRAQPPDAAGGDRRRLPQPRQALLGGLPRGPAPRQADGRPRPARAAHGEGIIALTGCLASRFCQRLVDGRDGRGARPRRRPDRAPSGADNVYFEVQKNGIADAGQGQRGHRPDRARGRPPARRHRRRALPAPRGLPPPHGAAVRADEVDARGAEDDLRHERVLPALQRGDGRGVRASGPRRSPRRSRSPSAATSRSSSAAS